MKTSTKDESIGTMVIFVIAMK